MSKNKILVIGHSVVDKIHRANSTTTMPGGIYYSIKGFLNSPYSAEIFLLTEIQNHYINFFQPEYSKLNLIDGYLVQQMPVNHLYIYDDKERDEVYEYIPKNLDLGRVKNVNDFDAILINMVSGFELDGSQLEELRKNFDGIIYIDVHTLSRGVYKNNKRKFRTIPDKEKWLANTDFIQANKLELKTLGDNVSEQEIVNLFFRLGGKGIIITEGELGSRGYFPENGEIKMISAPAKIKANKACVGCGDYFASSFLSAYLNTLSFENSLILATELSGKFAVAN